MMFVDDKILVLAVFLVIQVTGSALYGQCESNENCGTFDTHCNDNGTCACLDNFIANDDTCLQLANPSVGCTSKKQCHKVLGGRSFCKTGICVCKSFHHLFKDQCVKSKGLDEVCEFDHQCYCGHNCHQRIECFEGMCRCKPGHKQHSRLCVAVKNSVIAPIPTVVIKSSVSSHVRYVLFTVLSLCSVHIFL